MTPRAHCVAWLPRVSRTFAVNIERLPDPLRDAVRVAYLLCRIADTLEDDEELGSVERRLLLASFAGCMSDAWQRPASLFREALPPAWRDPSQPSPERALVAQAEQVLEEWAGVSEPGRGAIAACVRTMCEGMAESVGRRGPDGWLRLESTADLLAYCQCVAGSVGWLLDDLFAWHDASIARRPDSRARAAALGRGLQLVNIARDVAADGMRRTAYVPRAMALGDVLELARRELLEAQHYVLGLPRRAVRIRFFCIWPLLLAYETANLLARRAEAAWQPAARLKLGRGRVWMTAGCCVAACLSNALLRAWLGACDRRAARRLMSSVLPERAWKQVVALKS